MTAAEARAAIEAETGVPVELVPETMRLRVAAPDGRSFETAYEAKLASPYDPRDGLAERLDRTAPREPYDRYGLVLATPALDGRVLGVTRAMRRLSAELPEPAAVRAQLEGMYGPPSQVEQTPDRLEMVWAWGEDGPIADLEGQPARTLEHDVAPGDIRRYEYQPCRTTGSLIYEFEHPRERPLYPGCVALYTATYSSEIGHTTLSFDLYDFALARADHAEADRQIVDKVLGEEVEPVAPSDLDL